MPRAVHSRRNRGRAHATTAGPARTGRSLARVPLLIALLAAFSLGAPQHVAAQQGDAQYKAVVDEALAEFERGNFEEAYALFRRAHVQSPSARTLRGMGLSAFEARKYTIAVQSLNGALAETRKPLTKKQREQVQQVRDRALGFVGLFDLELAPADAQLRVDGRPPHMDDAGRLLLDPGDHEVVVTAAEHQTLARRVAVSSGDRGTLQLTMVATASAGPPDEGPDRYARPAPTGREGAMEDAAVDEGGPDYLWAIVAAGGAVVFVGTALTFHLVATSNADDVETACAGMCPPATTDALIADANIETYQTLSIVGWSLAGASAITAGILFALAGDDSEGTGVAVAPTPGGVVVSGRF